MKRYYKYNENKPRKILDSRAFPPFLRPIPPIKSFSFVYNNESDNGSYLSHGWPEKEIYSWNSARHRV